MLTSYLEASYAYNGQIRVTLNVSGAAAELRSLSLDWLTARARARARGDGGGGGGGRGPKRHTKLQARIQYRII